ncbi:hypothetical protein [Pedobacter miscanthi]|uniref:DUF4831 domain-containing protein n=1 Tax=Pedobacter miscanthi TaxID=2259170 RepID=A0A366L6Y8_9SPHI|nr:hypothetical protein [Pedobacter miscanthi]RBQ09054.1 hypothetical protein DRW42_07600 [Pedobacter miscanthi]
MKNIFLLLLSAMLLSLSACAQSPIASNPTPIKIEKKAGYITAQPYYQIDFSAALCLFEVRVNDVLVFMLDLPGQTSSTMPINQAILQSGKQQISVKLLPMAGQKVLSPDASFKYTIKVYDAAKNLDFKEQLPGEYAVEKVNPAKKQASLSQTATFNAEVPYTVNAYQTGTDLKSVAGLNDKLHRAYQKLAEMIAKGDLEELKKLITNREELAAVTMYLSKEESDGRMKSMLGDLKSGFKMLPIPANAQVKLSANGKIASLVTPTGGSVIKLRNEKAQEEMELEFTFYIPVGKTALEII